jgi:hypothetical protein
MSRGWFRINFSTLDLPSSREFSRFSTAGYGSNSLAEILPFKKIADEKFRKKQYKRQ